MKVTPELFVVTWHESSSLKEICDKLDMGYHAVSARACCYRQRGVPLKKMPYASPSRKVDYAALAELAKQKGGGEV